MRRDRSVTAHPITRRWFAEELVRQRRADEEQRWLASQRAGRIDPNPHQVDAVIFALQRIREGGCILADEVGLGKTIEAGLVIAQLRAEGATRILLITPRPLLGQWRQELAALFSIEAREARLEDPDALRGPGVFLIGREMAGSERGAAALMASDRFDLCVIDEAHEIFAGIYKRFDRKGRARGDGGPARLAARVRRALFGTPVLLLTATPIQNSLSELWGLVQYVEPTGTLLGDLPTFRAVFCGADDRELKAGADEELRRRIAKVCQRTLRRQAQEFMKRPFVDRRAQLFEYEMSPEERALYDDVTAYLMRPRLCAFRGGARRLLLLGFHRRMASSTRALAASLDNVAARLERMLLPRGDDATLDMFARDLEDDSPEAIDRPDEPNDEPDEEPNEEQHAQVEPEARPDTEIRRELAEVRALADRARSLPHDAKADQLVRAVRLALSRPGGSGKVVIFTESLTTQDFIAELLVRHDVVAETDVTRFRGDNTGLAADRALARWWQEIGDRMPGHARPSRDVAMRLALVHEFATRTKVFVATEAGAKGLNLQFCDTLVNYDLPWNPQRIEQRIGRCHRYGQTRGVLVVNFLARDNAAQRLTFEILSRKLDLFGTVLDASDVVLHEPSTRAPEMLTSALGLDLEARLSRIYERARDQAELEAEMARLSEHMGEARVELEKTFARTAGLIETRLDASVRGAFRRLDERVAEGLRSLDRDLEGVVVRWLEAIDAPFSRHAELFATRIEIAPSDRLPARMAGGAQVVVGGADPEREIDVLHLGHPLVQEAVAEARAASARPFSVRLRCGGDARLRPLVGRGGRLVVVRVSWDGFEPVQHLLPVAWLAGDDSPLSAELAHALVLASPEDHEGASPSVSDADIDDALEEALFLDATEVEPREQERLDEALDRIERFVEDRILVLESRRAELTTVLADARRQRDTVAGADARTRAEAHVSQVEEELEELDAALARLRTRADDDYEKWRSAALVRRYTPPHIDRILDVQFIVST